MEPHAALPRPGDLRLRKTARRKEKPAATPPAGLTAARIRRMNESRLELLEACFADRDDATNTAITARLGRKPRSVMALTRRTIIDARLAGETPWEKAKQRADAEWGPACSDEVRARGIAGTLEGTSPERFTAAADPGMASAARRLLPLVLNDVLDRSSRYRISANATGRKLAEAIQRAARRPRAHSFAPLTELLKQTGVQPGPWTENVIRGAGYETSGDYAVFDGGNRPRIQMMLPGHPAGIGPDRHRRTDGRKVRSQGRGAEAEAERTTPRAAAGGNPYTPRKPSRQRTAVGDPGELDPGDGARKHPATAKSTAGGSSAADDDISGQGGPERRATALSGLGDTPRARTRRCPRKKKECTR